MKEQREEMGRKKVEEMPTNIPFLQNKERRDGENISVKFNVVIIYEENKQKEL
jgi:hypothetical protein